MFKKNSLRDKVNSKQEWRNEEICFDPDSSPLDGMHFDEFYKDIFRDYEMESPDYFTNVFDNGKIRSEFIELKCGCEVDDKRYNYVKLNIKGIKSSRGYNNKKKSILLL